MRLFITGGSGFIGTNAVEHFQKQGATVLNYDLASPLNPAQNDVWHRGDIMDAPALARAMQAFAPEAVFHLAGRAECDENTTVEAGYQSNTQGTQNVLNAIRATPGVQRSVITSSQFVCGPGYQPRHDEDYAPVTIYGQSKVITEQFTRAADLPGVWTLIRPTNIWGPWHRRYQREFWRAVQRGFYVHPAGAPIVRCYGYVGTVLNQVSAILAAPAAQVHRQVFYVSDPPADIYTWTNAFSLALRGTPVRKVPRSLLHLLGHAGDLIGKLTGKPFYITTSRYRSMTSDYFVDMQKTFQAFPTSPVPLETGVQAVTAWLKSETPT